MFLRILKQSVFRDWKRKQLAILTIFLSACLITALLNLSIGVGDKMTKELKSYGANINVLPKSESIPLNIGGVDYNPLKGQVFLEEKDLPDIKDIFWRNNVTGFAPFLKIPIDVSTAEGEKFEKISLIGTFFNKLIPIPDEDTYHTGVHIVFPYWEVEGGWPQEDPVSDPLAILAGVGIAKKMGLQVGDRLLIQPTDSDKPAVEMVLSGLLSTGGNEENGFVAPLAVVQKLADLQGKIQSISVSALTVPEDHLSRKARQDESMLDDTEWDVWYCTAYVSSISLQIEEVIPGSTARPIWQVAASEGVIIKKIQLLMAVVTLAAFISSGLGISSLMTTSIMERSKEIGLVKALGATNAQVFLLFLIEAALVGVIGGLLGWGAGSILSQFIGILVFGSTVSVSLIVIPLIVFISVLIALAGSFIPARMIIKLYPAEVLHGR
jgi:putative ABC transport system permease protein